MSTFESAATLDIPFARKVLEHLTAHPGEHRQASFGHRTPCRTTACIAGAAVMMSDSGRFEFDTQGWMTDPGSSSAHGIPRQAAELLGLSYADAHELFYEFNSRAARRRLAHYIAQAEEVQS